MSEILKHFALTELGGKFGPNPRWSNADMDPVPPEERTSRDPWNYVAYWVSDATNASAWQLASSMLAVGPPWRQGLAIIAVGPPIIAVVVVLNGTIGARLHVAFPVLTRSSIGFWLSYFSVVSRVMLAMFWFGIQTYTGSEAVYQMLQAIWPSLARPANHLGENASISTSGILCYFLYCLVQLPFLLLSPHHVRHLFTMKSILVPIAWFAILIWAMVKALPSVSLGNSPARLSPGSTATWLWLGATNSAIGNYSTLSVNITVVDYRLVHRGNVNVVSMYDSNGIYRYWNGINWRAAVALIVSVVPNLPGLINNIDPFIEVGNAKYIFKVAWLFGLFTVSGVYWMLSTLFPAKGTYTDARYSGKRFGERTTTALDQRR